MAFSAELLGKRLKEARQRKGLKQSYVAEKVDLSEQHLSRIENGAKPIYVHKLCMICELLDVSVADMLAQAQEPMGDEDARAAFAEIARDCSGETVRAMLETCRAIANVERRAKQS